MIIRAVIMALLVLAPASALAGNIYKHTDENGVLTITDVPSSGSTRVSHAESKTEKKGQVKADYSDIIISKANKYNIDPQLIHAVISVESAFNESAVSKKGALGLMQVMPATAEEMGVVDPSIPEQNIEAGTRYLKYLLERFDGDLSLALAAYNAGPESVERHGQIPPISETVNYVKKIYKIYSPQQDTKTSQPTIIYKIVLEDGTVIFTDTKIDPSRL